MYKKEDGLADDLVPDPHIPVPKIELPIKVINIIAELFGGDTKKRRIKKQKTRQAGIKWGAKDCTAGEDYLSCTKNGKITKCYYRGKPPGESFTEGYKLVWNPCMEAYEDVTGRQKKFQSLFNKFPKKDPFVIRRGQRYKDQYKRQYGKWYDYFAYNLLPEKKQFETDGSTWMIYAAGAIALILVLKRKK